MIRDTKEIGQMATTNWQPQIEKCIEALGSISLFAGSYGSSVDGQRQFHEVLKALRPNGPLCDNVATAIQGFLSNKTVELGGPPGAKKVAQLDGLVRQKITCRFRR